MGFSTRAGSRGESRLERISRRARELYEARGGEHGRDLEDWLTAEREIDAAIEREAEEQARALLDSEKQ
jgi:hypothetical protein